MFRIWPQKLVVTVCWHGVIFSDVFSGINKTELKGHLYPDSISLVMKRQAVNISNPRFFAHNCSIAIIEHAFM